MTEIELKNNKRLKQPKESIEKALYEIAEKNLYTVKNRGDLETHHSDGEDFIEVAIWELKSALKEAYEAGRRSK